MGLVNKQVYRADGAAEDGRVVTERGLLVPGEGADARRQYLSAVYPVPNRKRAGRRRLSVRSEEGTSECPGTSVFLVQWGSCSLTPMTGPD